MTAASRTVRASRVVPAVVLLAAVACQVEDSTQTEHNVPEECFERVTEPPPTDDVNVEPESGSPWWLLQLRIPTDPACAVSGASNGFPTSIVWSESGELREREMAHRTTTTMREHDGRCEITLVRDYSDPMFISDRAFGADFEVRTCGGTLVDRHAASYEVADFELVDFSVGVESGNIAPSLPLGRAVPWSDTVNINGCEPGVGGIVRNMVPEFYVRLSVDMESLALIHSSRGAVNLDFPMRLDRL